MHKLITPEHIILSIIKKSNSLNSNYAEMGICGRKTLQKCLYLLNQHVRLFHFRWGQLGPFSDQLYYVLDDLISRGYIKSIRTYMPYMQYSLYQLEYQKNVDSFFESLVFPPDINSLLDKTLTFISNKSPRDLELLTSVHFWAKRQQFDLDTYTIEYIFEKIDTLKPSSNFTKSDIQDAIKILEEEKYLISTSPNFTKTSNLQYS